MFREKLDQLTSDDVKRLAAAGVPASRVSEWRHANRLPTRTQALAFSTVLGIDLDQLNRELTAIEAAQDAKKNNGIAQLLKTAKVRSILIQRALA